MMHLMGYFKCFRDHNYVIGFLLQSADHIMHNFQLNILHMLSSIFINHIHFISTIPELTKRILDCDNNHFQHTHKMK